MANKEPNVEEPIPVIKLEFERDYWPAGDTIATRDGAERIVVVGDRILAGEVADLPATEAKAVSRAGVAKLAE